MAYFYFPDVKDGSIASGKTTYAPVRNHVVELTIEQGAALRLVRLTDEEAAERLAPPADADPKEE